MLQGVIRLFETVIKLMKSNGYNIAAVRQLNVGNSNVKKTKWFCRQLSRYITHIAVT